VRAPAADEPSAATAGEPSAATTEMSATAYADVSTATAAASHLGGCDIGRQCRRAERRDSRKCDDALV
jgi:hypothetical protein